MDIKPKLLPIRPAPVKADTSVASAETENPGSSDKAGAETDGKPKVKSEGDKPDAEEFECMWTDCHQVFTSSPSLVRHANTNHLNTNSIAATVSASATGAAADGSTTAKYSCLWEGCPRYGAEQPSRFALISHCRTHTGEKPYFCPIPECEKHFTRSDALAKHVKGVHDLHVLKDAVSLIKDRAKKAKAQGTFTAEENITEAELLRQVEQDYEFQVPWWFSNSFLNIVSDSGEDLSVYRIPLQTVQLKIAKKRYESYYFDENTKGLDESLKPLTASLHPENMGPDIDSIEDLDQLKSIHESLRMKLTTASKVNKIVTSQLQTLVEQKRKLWAVNQILLDGNARLSIPRKSDNDGNQPDKYDTELYDSIKSV